MKVKRTLPKSRTEVKLKTTDAELTSRGGLLLIEELAHKLELAAILDRNLTLKERQRGYTESEHILALAYSMLEGASCLDDIERLRKDKQTQRILQVGGIPHPTTLGDFLRRFSLGHIRQFEKAIGEVRRKIHRIETPEEVTVDMDSKVFEKHGHQEGVNRTYRGTRGYHPQFAFRADTAECVFAKLQRGSAYTARQSVRMLKATLAQLPESAQVVNVRADSGWYQEDFLRACENHPGRVIFYSITADQTGPLLAKIQALAEDAWQPFGDDESVAELYYQSTNGLRPRRYIVKRREKKTDSKGQCLLDFPEYRYHAIVTNDGGSAPAEAMAFSLKRAAAENHLKQLEYDLSLNHFPCGSFMANWAYLLCGVLAYNLAVWLKSHVLPEDYRGATIKTLRHRFFHAAGQVVKSGRQLWLALKRTYAYLSEYRESLGRLRRLKFT